MLHELSDEELGKVNGGYIYDTHTIAWDGNNAYNKYEVIDDTTGSVLQTVKSYSEAFRIAQQRGISTKQISKAQLNRLRETGSLD